MSTVEYNKIVNILGKEDIHFDVIGSPQKEYTVGSIFNPIPNGFYFLVESADLGKEAKGSLVLTNTNDVQLPKNTVSLLVEENPQLVFYKVLSTIFGETSTGCISDLAVVSKEADIGENVQIDPFAVVGNCVLEDNVIVKSHAVIRDNSIVKEKTVINEHSSIGASGIAWIWDEDKKEKVVQPQLGGVIIEKQCIIGAHAVLVRGSLSEYTKIGKHTLIAPGARIGHGTIIGPYAHLANDVVTGGNTCIGAHCFIGSGTVFRPKVKIADQTIVGAGAVVIKNIQEKGKTLMGVPAEAYPTKNNPSGMPSPFSVNQ